MEPKKMGKRIVSKGEYVRMQGKRVGFGVSGMCLFFMAGLCGLIAIILALASMCALSGLPAFAGHTPEGIAGLVGSLLAGICACTLGAASYRSLNRVAELKGVVPLTRANIADLPAPDSLVRASDEPRQEQEAVLLRAAMEGHERSSEQLVRAAEGPHSGAV